jgi:hypothetical protein
MKSLVLLYVDQFSTIKAIAFKLKSPVVVRFEKKPTSTNLPKYIMDLEYRLLWVYLALENHALLGLTLSSL